MQSKGIVIALPTFKEKEIEGVFGAIVYMHIRDKKRKKLDPKSKKCILIGYSLEQKGYKCYNTSTR